MANASTNETVIAQGVKVEGDFHSSGNVVIDGEVTGSIQTASALRIGETAKIHADMTAQTAVVSGQVQGNIRVADRLEILETADINGDIDAKTLSVVPGAKINGRISMGGGVKPAAPEEGEE